MISYFMKMSITFAGLYNRIGENACPAYHTKAPGRFLLRALPLIPVKLSVHLQNYIQRIIIHLTYHRAFRTQGSSDR